MKCSNRCITQLGVVGGVKECRLESGHDGKHECSINEHVSLVWSWELSPKGVPRCASSITINWTLPLAEEFKRVYVKAIKTNGSKDTFLFLEQEFVVGYAKYFLEYLKTTFSAL